MLYETVSAMEAWPNALFIFAYTNIQPISWHIIEIAHMLFNWRALCN